MEREEAIKICKEIRKYLCAGNPIWDTDKIHEALTTAIIDMKMMPRLEQITVNWISADIPPQNHGKYLCTLEYDDGRSVDTACYDGEWYFMEDGIRWDIDTVVAYTELPKPF